MMLLVKVRPPIDVFISARKRFRQARGFIRLCYRDLRENTLGQIFPIQPRILNLLVNDICDSQYQICFVGRQKRNREFTPEELALILSDPLFGNLRYVGVSGGEPTLREDLPEIYHILVQKRPPIGGTGIITNAIRADDVIARCLASAKVCREGSIPFNIMVSLDGIGEIHDHIRGRKGNFESAVAVIRYFRDNTDIPISIGCTVTKDNVWYVDDVLDFCRREDVYGRFRVAEFIRRLYNDEQRGVIRNFTEREAYHLGLFFAKLEHEYETSPMIRRTYRNIRQMLMEGTERSIGCPWQSTAVTLDCRGQLLYCAPRSPVLGSCLEESAQKLYRKSIKERKAILKHECKSCIHDYHAEETISEKMLSLKERVWRWRLSLDKALAEAAGRSRFRLAPRQRKHSPGQILIVGWYGTETAGDKAILGEIIYQIRNRHSNPRIVLASLYPYVSRQTVQELGYPDIEIIPTYSARFWQHTGMADEVIMGGGPLMHLELLGIVLWAFIRAKTAGHHTYIAGCGIGPLDQEKYQSAVQHILSLADIIELRDTASVAWAKRMTGRGDIVNSGDPAEGFVRRWMDQHSPRRRGSFLNLYLRDWTTEYQGSLTNEQFKETKVRFEQQLGQWVHTLCAQLDLRPRLLPMHHFCVGGDDRDFNRRFAETYLADLNPVVERMPLSLHELLASMQEARLSLCMRFHSVLFANTLGAPFFAIDYTQGGKITSYLRDHGRLDRMLSLRDVADGKWQHTVKKETSLDTGVATT